MSSLETSIDHSGIRRRRKTVRSCTFCRQRKLKCDQSKPMCGSCTIRKLPECVYTDGFNFQLTSDELFKGKPNIALIKRIQELEEELSDRQADEASDGCKVVLKQEIYRERSGYTGGNRVLDFRVLSLKNGGYMYYGPTAVQATFTASGERFILEYGKLWRRVEIECQQWEAARGIPLKKEILPMQQSMNGTVIDAVVQDLPSFNVIKGHLELYFESHLHDFYQILDRQKVLADLHSCFLHANIGVESSEDVPVILLAGQDGKNFYTIGIVLEILCFMYYKAEIPVSIEQYRVWLSGLSMANSSYVEKAQYLLLLYLSRIYNSYECFETSDVVNLVTMLCTASTSLGLNDNIYEIYQGQEHLVGDLATLQNLWYWTLFVDLTVSFDMGRPLKITEEHFDDFRLSTNERGRVPLLRNYLYIARKCMREVFDRKHDPDLEQLTDELTLFVEQHFRPIRYYTDKELIRQVDLFEVMILSPILNMISNFFNLRRILCTEVTMLIKNGFIKFVLMSLSLSINTMLRCYELDQLYHPNLVFSGEKFLTPFLNLSLLIGNSFLIRSLTELYSLFFYKVSLFEEGLIISTDEGIFQLSLEDFDVPQGNFLSFRGIYNKFRTLFDQIFKPEYSHMHRILFNSHLFVTIFALEKVNRTVFEKGLKSRNEVEVAHNWSQVNFEQISADVFQLMTENFWTNYDTEFSDLIEMDPSQFLTDFDQFSQSV